jgi:hypothetical protein
MTHRTDSTARASSRAFTVASLGRQPATFATALFVAALVPHSAQAVEGRTIADLLRSTHVHGLAVDRADPSRLLIATHHGFHAALPDGSVRQVSARQDDLMGFTPHPTKTGTLYSSGHPAEGGNLGFMMSQDGGRTWRQISPGVAGPVDFHQMDVSKADSNVVYGMFGGLQVSRDGGRTWSRVGSALQGVIDMAASSKDRDTLYLATRSGLQISSDGGKSWRPALLQIQPATMVESLSDGTLYAFVAGQGLLRAQEPALNWERVSDNFGERVILHLAADPAHPERLYAYVHPAELITSADGGRTWATFARPR